MKISCFVTSLCTVLCSIHSLSAVGGAPQNGDAPQVIIEYSESGASFQFEMVSVPAVNDAGAKGKWTIVAGKADPNAGSLLCLADGKIPSNADDPAHSFFLNAGSTEGVIAVDLEHAVELTQIVTYSWHTDSRAPQVYSVYTATGDEAGFELPKSAADMAQSSVWKKLADVDSRSRNRAGGQHAVSIQNAGKSLGTYRYLVFVVQSTEPGNRFSHTFFSEIDLVVGDAKTLERIAVPELREIRFATEDQTFRFTIDVTQALELEEWSSTELKPVIQEWYPKIVTMLPSDGFEAPHDVRFRYLRDAEMKGIPAYAAGTTVSLNAEWFRGQLNGEARGAVVHEMVHIVQKYPGRSRRNRNIMPPPGWLVEGIPDYIRWFLYEPETGGAKLSPQRLKSAKHDASYRTTANFIDWVIRSHPAEENILQRLNATARNGEYSADTWKQLTGKTEQELADAWRAGQ
ncbi:MAG: hypothetical protein JNM43_23070 [Planctomycetaceae bacterium]|nr:hypothetical protein [Planctomycetaceae bacterium]